MPFQFYKRIRLGKGFRLNLSKTGVGLTLGRKGAHYTIHSSGRQTRSVGIPGTGIYWRETRKLGRTKKRRAAPKLPVPPTVEFDTGTDDGAFARGLAAYRRGDLVAALRGFRAAMDEDTRGEHVAEEYLGALCLAALGRDADAIAAFQRVLAARTPIPDDRMRRHRVAGHADVPVTRGLAVRVPHGHLAAALLLTELYQRNGRTDDAVQLLESVGSVAPDPLFGLSLADLYAELGRSDDVLRVSEDFLENRDDVTAQLLVYRAHALREAGLPDAALQTVREALRSKSRDPDVLMEARYERALVYEAKGHAGRARADLEAIYASDPGYMDVAARLGMK